MAEPPMHRRRRERGRMRGEKAVVHARDSTTARSTRERKVEGVMVVRYCT